LSEFRQKATGATENNQPTRLTSEPLQMQALCSTRDWDLYAPGPPPACALVTSALKGYWWRRVQTLLQPLDSSARILPTGSNARTASVRAFLQRLPALGDRIGGGDGSPAGGLHAA